MATRPVANVTTSTIQSGRMLMPSRQDIEFARLRMLEVRKALADYEAINGFGISSERLRLIQVFARVSKSYLRLSANQKRGYGAAESRAGPLVMPD